MLDKLYRTNIILLMSSEKLISIEELVKRAKKQGVDFGKTDPYNRLRYYTKLSLLPHMERRQGKGGKLLAMYPEEALEKLLIIENLKAKGLKNEDIVNELEKKQYSFSNFFQKNMTQRNVTLLLILVALAVLILNQRGLINLSKERSQSPLNSQAGAQATISDSGTAVLRAGKRLTFVKSTKVSSLSQVQVAFKGAFFPATSYMIGTKVPQEGFILELDDITAEDVSFSWWITEN